MKYLVSNLILVFIFFRMTRHDNDDVTDMREKMHMEFRETSDD